MFAELKKDIIGYKSVKNSKGTRFLVTLLIPAGTRIYSSGFYYGFKASRHNFDDDKLRAECAEVLEIRQIKKTPWHLDNTLTNKRVDRIIHHSNFGPWECRETAYEVDEIIEAPNWCDQEEQCAGGIHFYVNKKRAMNWRG